MNHDILISNDYYIIDDIDNYKINIYYIYEYLCKIIIYQKNIKDNDIIIKLLPNELLSIGSIKEHIKIIEIYTNTLLQKSNEGYITDKKILVYDISNDNYIKLILDNPKIKFTYYDNIYKREFIKVNYNSILNLYDLFCDDYFKHIIFVCVYIYINGGIFVDENINLNKPLDIIGLNDKILLNNGILLLLISEKGNKNIIKYIDFLLYSTEMDNSFDISCKDLDPCNIKYCKNKYKILGNINNIIFLIEENEYDSELENNYKFEYLNLDYYMVSSPEYEINDDFYILCLNNNDSSIQKKRFNIDNRVNYNNRFIFTVYI